MLLEFDVDFGADISWISWFPHEMEVVFVADRRCAKAAVLRKRDGVQYVSVTEADTGIRKPLSSHKLMRNPLTLFQNPVAELLINVQSAPVRNERGVVEFAMFGLTNLNTARLRQIMAMDPTLEVSVVIWALQRTHGSSVRRTLEFAASGTQSIGVLKRLNKLRDESGRIARSSRMPEMSATATGFVSLLDRWHISSDSGRMSCVKSLAKIHLDVSDFCALADACTLTKKKVNPILGHVIALRTELGTVDSKDDGWNESHALVSGAYDSLMNASKVLEFFVKPFRYDASVFYGSNAAAITHVEMPSFNHFSKKLKVPTDELEIAIEFDAIVQAAYGFVYCVGHCTFGDLLDAIRPYLTHLHSRKFQLNERSKLGSHPRPIHTPIDAETGILLCLVPAEESIEDNIISVDSQRDVCPLGDGCPLRSEELIAEADADESEELLQHLDAFEHCKDAAVCELGVKCPVYARRTKLRDFRTLLADSWHLAAMRHPSNAGGKDADERESFKELVTFGYYIENRSEIAALEQSLKRSRWNYSEALLQEFKDNGKMDAVLSEMYAAGTTLVECVYTKMDHEKHVEMGSPLAFVEMMAVVLYTVGIGVNGMNAAIRNEQFEANPWPIWKTTLKSALLKLEKRQRRKCKVYRGVSGVRLPEDVRSAHFSVHLPAFVSTSLDRNTAMHFACGGGTLLEFDAPPETAQSFGAEVSWISWFSEELEVVFIPGNGNALLELTGVCDGAEIVRVHPFAIERGPVDSYV